MAKQLNKKLVVGLTIGAMILTAAAAVVMIATLPEKDPEYFVKQAKEASKSGEHVKAARLYARAWKVSQNYDYLVDAGDEFLASGDARQALGQWNQALLAKPDLKRAHEKILQLYLEYAKLSNAVQVWQQLYTAAEALVGARTGEGSATRPATKPIDPENPLGLHARGLATIAMRSDSKFKLADGEEDLRRAHELAPQNVDFASTLAEFYIQGGASPPTTPIPPLSDMSEAAVRARKELDDRTLAKAERIYTELVERAPEDAKAQRYLGTFLYVRRARFEEALKHLQKAVELAPGDIENHLAMGNYWVNRAIREAYSPTTQGGAAATTTRPTELNEQYLAEAETALKKAVEADPSAFLNYLALGEFYRQIRRDPKRACEAFNERLNKAVVRTTYLPEVDRAHKLLLIKQAFEATLAQVTPAATDDKANDALYEQADALRRKAVAEAAGGENDPEVLVLLAKLHTAKRQYAQARDAYLAAEQRMAGRDVAISYALADLYRLLGETGLAEQRLTEVVRQIPDNEAATSLLAAVLLTNNKPDAAMQLADRALAINPNNTTALRVQLDVYRQRGNWDKVREIDALLAGGSGQAETAESLVRRGTIAWLQAGNAEKPDPALLQSAEKDFRAALQKEPANLNALRSLISLLASAKRHDEIGPVLDSAEKAAKSTSDAKEIAQIEASLAMLRILSDPNKSDEERLKALEGVVAQAKFEEEYLRELNYADLYLRHGMPEKAVEHARKADSLKPDNPVVVDTKFRAGLTARDKAGYALAQEAVTKAKALNLDNVQGATYEARMFLTRNEPGDVELAIAALRPAAESPSTTSDIQTLYGRALQAANRIADAEAAFNKAIQLNPNQGLAYRGLAQIAEMKRDNEAYQKHLAQAQRLVPMDPWVQGKTQEAEEEKDPQKAIAQRESQRAALAAAAKPDSDARIANLLRLGQLYFNVRQYDKAEAAYKEAQEAGQARPEAERLATIPYYYSRFLAVKEPPEPERGAQVLRDFVASFGQDKRRQAAAQLMLAEYMAVWVTDKLPKAPTPDEVDAAFVAAVNVSPEYDVLMRVANWFHSTRRYDKAEEYFAKAAAAAGDNRAQENAARRAILQSRLAWRNLERREETDRLLAEYIAKYPDDAMGLLLQADHFMQTGRDEEAIKALTTYLQRDPKNAFALCRRGELYFRSERWDDAVADLKAAKSVAPAAYNYQHRILLARCYMRQQKPNDAIAELESIVKEDPLAQNAAQALVDTFLLLGQLDQAEERAIAFSRQFPTNYGWFLGIAQILENRNPPDAARIIGYYKQAAELSQFHPDLTGRVLRAMLKYKRYDDAIDYATNTIPKDRVMLGQRLSLATAYAEKGRKDLARQEFDSAAAASTDALLPLAMVAESAAQALGVEEAEQMVRTRVNADPNNRGALLAQAQLHIRKAVLATEQSKPDVAAAEYAAAEKGLRQVLEVTKENAERIEVLHRLAAVLMQAKKYDESQTVYKQVLEINPNDGLALNNIAFILMDIAGKPKESLEYARRAAAVAGSNSDILDTYGWNLALVERYREAISTLTEALQANDQSHVAYYHRARAFLGQSKTRSTPAEKTADLDRAKADALKAYELAAKAKDSSSVTPGQIADLLKELGVPVPAAPAGGAM